MESTKVALERVRDRIDTKVNDLLINTKSGYDDSITGMNEVWDLVRKIVREEIKRVSEI